MQLPIHSVEIERIYQATLGAGTRTLAITASEPDEGVSGLAQALVQRSLLAGRRTLLVDFNLHRPALSDALPLATASGDEVLPPPALVNTGDDDVMVVGVSAPQTRQALVKLRQPDVLERCIAQWQESFDCIVFDTSPINRINARNIPAERVAAACDGAILVTLAARTSNAHVNAAVQRLNVAGARLLGCVFNDRDNPPLRRELLRETRRLERRLPKLARWLAERIRKSPLMALEI